MIMTVPVSVKLFGGIVLVVALLLMGGQDTTEITNITNVTINATEHDDLTDVGSVPIDTKHLFNDVEQGGAIVRTPDFDPPQTIAPNIHVQPLRINETTFAGSTHDILDIFTQTGTEVFAIDTDGVTFIRDLETTQSTTFSGSNVQFLTNADLNDNQLLDVNSVFVNEDVIAGGNITATNFTATEDVFVNRDLTVTGNTTTNDLLVEDVVHFLNTLLVDSTATFNGDVNIGDSPLDDLVVTSDSFLSATTLGGVVSDNINFIGRVNSDIDPDGDHTRSLGSSALGWLIDEPKIQGGIDNGGTGFQHQIRMFTIPGTTTTTETFNWANTFDSTSYTATCTLQADSNNGVDNINLRGIRAKTTTSIDLRIQNTLLGSQDVTINCIGVHNA